MVAAWYLSCLAGKQAFKVLSMVRSRKRHTSWHSLTNKVL